MTLPTRRPVASRRGTVFVLAIWVILILSGLALVYARSMRVEMVAAGNRLSMEQAAAVERGAEQYVLARIDAAMGDATEVTRAPAEAVAVGDGYFWIIRSHPTDAQFNEYGIADEAAKLNLNVADPTEIMKLPGMDQYVANAILDWRDEDTTLTEGGAESDYYLAQQPLSYNAKDGLLESVEELRLVKGVTDELLYGDDRNRNGAADDPLPPGVMPRRPGRGSNEDRRGITPFVTVVTAERNEDADGKTRVSVAAGNEEGTPPAQPPGGGGPNPQMAQQVAEPTPGAPSPTPAPGQPGAEGGGGQNDAAIREVLLKSLKADRVDGILGTAKAAGAANSVLDFAAKGGMNSEELDDVSDYLTHTDDKSIRGRINVNTAPREVLACLPGVQSSDVDALLNSRPADPKGGIGWVVSALTPEVINLAGKAITGRSWTYSADIVSVSGDGRAFKRVRILVDGRQSPPVILQRKDLTSLGWPMSQALRDQMRAGTKPVALFQEVRPQGSSSR